MNSKISKLAAVAGLVALLLGGYYAFKPATNAVPITQLAKQAKTVQPDLPPNGTRSLFDHLIAQNEGLPYPFPKLVEYLEKTTGHKAQVLMIPHGRSLLKGLADDKQPRVLLALDAPSDNNAVSLGLNPRGQLFLGFVEAAGEIEVLSYNEAAGRFEFQLVQDYRAQGQRKIVYAKRAICETCHQGSAPIFPQRPWNETNGQPDTAAALQSALNSEQYLGLPVRNALSVPERYDELADIGSSLVLSQQVWQHACATSACRRALLKEALQYLLAPSTYAVPVTSAQLPLTWTQAVPNNDLLNRDPIGEQKGFKGWLRSLYTRPIKHGEGAKDNEDLSSFEKLPALPLELDPLSVRPSIRKANFAEAVAGLAQFFTVSDAQSLEKQGVTPAAVDALPDTLFANGQPFARVSIMQALLSNPSYCCLNTAEMSPPVLSGEPPVVLAAGSKLKPFEAYCFGCHRGNPAKRLNFMTGKTEAEVLANVQAKAEIREALDWPRYTGTDKASKLMPPSDAPQHALLQEALKKDPQLLENMRAVVPNLFGF